jgi:hypothetical protein
VGAFRRRGEGVIRVTLLAAGVAEAGPLRDALALRGLPAEVATPETLRLDFAERRRHDVIVNCVADHPDPAVRLLVGDALAWLGDIGASVVNGLDAFVVGSSPARQAALFAHLGLDQPPARVVAHAGLAGGVLAELGLGADEAEILDGPPAVVRARVTGDRVRLAFVGGRLVGDAAGLDDQIAAAAAEVLGTAGIEFGGVTLGRDGGAVWWLGADSRLDDAPEVLGAVAEHVRFRAGLS